MKLPYREYNKYKEEEYSIRNDIIFKIVFGTNENSHLLRNFLEAILKRKITNIVVRNEVPIHQIHVRDKLSKLDLLVEVENSEKINIEIQNVNEYNIIKRGIFYASGIYHTSLKESQKYQDNLKAIVILITGFNIFKDGTYHEKGVISRESTGEVLTEDVEFHYIQLPRFIEQVREIQTPEEQWLAYLSCSLNKEELGELFKMSRSIEEINKIVDIVMEDNDVYDELNRRINARYDEMARQYYAEKRGEEAGMKRGMKQGIKQEKIEMAKRMLAKNKSIEEIMEFTGLTKEEIDELK